MSLISLKQITHSLPSSMASSKSSSSSSSDDYHNVIVDLHKESDNYTRKLDNYKGNLIIIPNNTVTVTNTCYKTYTILLFLFALILQSIDLLKHIRYAINTQHLLQHLQNMAIVSKLHNQEYKDQYNTARHLQYIHTW